MSNRKLLTQLNRALVFGIALIASGCNIDGLFGNDGGRVRLVLSPDGTGANSNVIPDSTGSLLDEDDDDERPRGLWLFNTANVTLSSVLVRTSDGELVDLDVDLPISVDVVKIDGGKHIALPDGVLPVGDYDQVVLVITAVQAIAHDGTVITIEPPGGGWTSIIPICPLAVVEGETATVGIAFNVRNSFLRLNNWWSFQPRFRSLNDCDDQ
jgi:hypothetical protein